RIDEMGHAEAFTPGLLVIVDVDADDHVGAHQAQALYDIEADAAEAEYDGGRARFDLGRVDDRADAGGDAAADVADLVERRLRVDLGDGDFGQDGEVGEGRAAHVMEDALAADREARGPVGHQALPLGGADRGVQIGVVRQARRALAAFGRVERNDVIALAYRGHARSDIDHDAGAFMAESGRDDALRVVAGQGELVGVADAGRLDLDQHLAGLRSLQVDLHDLERLARPDGDGGTCLHVRNSWIWFDLAGKVTPLPARSIRPSGRWRMARAFSIEAGGAGAPARDPVMTTLLQRLKAIGIDFYMLLLFATVALAVLVPASGTGAVIVSHAAYYGVALLFFLYGARLDPAAVWDGLRNWRLQGGVFAMTYLAFPLIGLALSFA